MKSNYIAHGLGESLHLFTVTENQIEDHHLRGIRGNFGLPDDDIVLAAYDYPCFGLEYGFFEGIVISERGVRARNFKCSVYDAVFFPWAELIEMSVRVDYEGKTPYLVFGNLWFKDTEENARWMNKFLKALKSEVAQSEELRKNPWRTEYL